MAHSLWEDIKAWRALARLMPGWQPSFEGLQKIDEGKPELVVAIRAITRGWHPGDARWDVLQGVLAYARREHAHELAELLRSDSARIGGDPGMDWAADLIDPEVDEERVE